MHHVITAATSGRWAGNDTLKRFQLNYCRYRQRQIFNIRGEIATYYPDTYFTVANLEEGEITFVRKIRTIAFVNSSTTPQVRDFKPAISDFFEFNILFTMAKDVTYSDRKKEVI